MKRTIPLLILLLTGCVTTVQTPGTPPPAPTAQPAPVRRKTVVDKRIVIDPALDHVIRIVGLKTAEAQSGFLKIQVDVQNLGDALKQFSYRIDWYDREGMALPLAASSMPWTLLPHETSFLAATSPTPSARDFRITFIAPGD